MRSCVKWSMLVNVSLLIAGLCLWPLLDRGWALSSEIQNPKSEVQNQERRPAKSSQSAEKADRQQLAKEYSRGWYRFYFISQAYTFLALFLIVWTGLSARLRDLSERVTRRRWRVILIYGGLFIVLLAMLFFPLDVYAFWREKRYGFATQNFTGWLGDQLKGLGVAVALGLPTILAVYTVFKKAPRTWWLWGSGILIGFVIFVVALAPIFIDPLFNTFEPLRDQALRQRILTLAHEHGIPAHGVYQVDASRQSTHTNACVVGLLGTQRVVLYDTLLENFTPAEVEFVVAHEIGHYRLNHIWKGIGLASLLIVIGMWLLHQIVPRMISRYQHRFGFKGLADVASLPLLVLLLSISTFALSPLSNSISRYMEHQADLFGLQAASYPEAAFSVFKKFETLDLSEPDPPPFIEFWLYSHPSLQRRIEAAKEFLQTKTQDPKLKVQD
ncbi:MAG: M48 family metallopeptidase [Acidobacteria bacterium]|nr:M48 family metallopeptidase [Acidobacteriota bacterium]